jgi:hypothetical protein
MQEKEGVTELHDCFDIPKFPEEKNFRECCSVHQSIIAISPLPTLIFFCSFNGMNT